MLNPNKTDTAFTNNAVNVLKNIINIGIIRDFSSTIILMPEIDIITIRNAPENHTSIIIPL